MNRGNYDDEFNMFKGFDDGFGGPSDVYQNNNYQINQGEYGANDWGMYNQGGYNDNYQYDYFDDNIGYIYDDQYSIDYSNSSSNFMGYDYGYNASDDISLFDLSSKINANCESELFFERAAGNNFNIDANGYEDPGNSEFIIEDNELDLAAKNGYNSYGNRTVPMEDGFGSNFNGNFNSNFGNDFDDRYDEHQPMYNGLDTNSEYFDRNGAYDNKIMPTEDIMFDDMYIVKNQLFEEEEKLFSFNDIVSLAICVAFAIIMAFLINRYAGQITTVDGHSMEYNFHHKEIVVIDKLSYKLKKPERYDVVIFPVKSGGEYKHYIKRIIGLPGEKVYVDVQKSEIYIDDKKLDDEIYAWENYSGYGLEVDINNITLSDDEYYCMGDNRNNSMDSRSSSVGPIKGGDFVGKAVFKISPITSFGFIDHKYNHDIRNGKREAYPFE